jgi:hypothetical protein
MGVACRSFHGMGGEGSTDKQPVSNALDRAEDFI